MIMLILFGLAMIATLYLGWRLHKSVQVSEHADLLEKQLKDARESHEKGNANRARTDADIVKRLREKGILRD